MVEIGGGGVLSERLELTDVCSIQQELLCTLIYEIHVYLSLKWVQLLN